MKKPIVISLGIGGILLGLYLAVVYWLPLSIPPITSSLVLRDVHDEEIGEIIADERIRHREIRFDDIPSFYLLGIVWLEDRSFWQNNGISLRGIMRSMVHNIEAGKVVEGASTLSAQFIRNALWINEKRDLSHKILESLYAMRLNHLMSKEEILTAYINRIGFGYLNYGLKSASFYYFGKEPKYLTQAEQIALLVIPKNPNTYDPYENPISFQKRFDMIVSTFELGGLITSEDAKMIQSEKLIFRKDHRATLPYIVDFIKGRENISRASTLETTIDASMTQQIDRLSRGVLDELSWRNVSDYGILIAERTPQGPKLRVMIGGKDYHESLEGQVNTTLSQRQPGSTLKPFTYLLAFSRLALTPESVITDLPVQYKTSEGYSYEPKNYSQTFEGEVTLREALSQSINIPAIKLLERVGVQNLLDFLHSVGIASLDKTADHYGLALTLGDGEVTLYELLQAYSIFAYDGEYCEIGYIANSAVPCITRADKKYTDMVVSILSDRYAKLPGFPLHSSLDFADRWVALKTGTSRNFRDNWTVGFTEHYMIGVWTGNKNGENMKGVSGATGAGEIFARIVYALEKEEYTPSVIQKKKEKEAFLEITTPLDGSVYEREDTKSDERQKIALTFRTNIPYDTSYWIIDGKETQDTLVKLVTGIHTVELVLKKEGKEQIRKKSVFEVTGK